MRLVVPMALNEYFQANGGSLVMLAKGNCSKAATDACKAHGGFYLTFRTAIWPLASPVIITI